MNILAIVNKMCLDLEVICFTDLTKGKHKTMPSVIRNKLKDMEENYCSLLFGVTLPLVLQSEYECHSTGNEEPYKCLVQ